MFGLPVLVYAFFFACNDVSGCPAPALFNLSELTWDRLKSQIPWPQDGLSGFITLEAAGWTFAYYLLSLILFRVLPAHKVLGTKLRESGRPLDYSFNGKHPVSAFSGHMV